jgi:hypothetical protein
MRPRKAFLSMLVISAVPVLAQGPAPSFPPQELDRLVSRIALYPDPLLTQILAAATYPEQLQDAERWADQHHYLTQDALASAIMNDQLPFDPSVQALLPFPSVLDMMISDMRWTQDLGDAFLSQGQEVMDAVQRMRRQAWDYGYLRSSGQIVVSSGPYISIMPANPSVIYVPYYDPGVVFVRPRPGFAVRGAIRFNFGVTLGLAFRPWGWGYNRFDWGNRVVIINNEPWRRTWVNRHTYQHPYTVRRFEGNRIPERHEMQQRDQRERQAPQRGDRRVEDHREQRRSDQGKGQGKGQDKGRGKDR